jgi:F0F1-type ATP synthase assembly protein I
LSLTPEQNDILKHDELIFNLVQKRMYDELDRIDKLDSKSNNLIALSGVLAGFFIGVSTNQIAILSRLPYGVVFVLILGVGLLIVSIVFSLRAMKIRRWTVVPDPKVLIDEYKSKTYLETLRPVAVEMSLVQEEMVKANNQKAHLIDLSWDLLLCGLGVTFVFVILLFLSVGT